MSVFSCPVIQIEKIEKHPNADSLSITEAEGCPVIVRTGDFQVGDLAIYVPIEAVVPCAGHQNSGPFRFLAKKEGQVSHRIKAVKLRGIFSMGLLIKISDVLLLKYPEVGEDVSGQLGIVKYEEPPPKNLKLGGQRERSVDSHTAPIYDIESHRKYKHLYQPGEEVVVTEKIHGCNGRFVYRQAEGEEVPRLFVGSRNFFLKQGRDVWWQMAQRHGLAEKLAKIPGVVIYGEVYGQIQDLKYGTSQNDPLRFAAFDAYDRSKGRYLDYADFRALCTALDLPTVPVLYQGPYDADLMEHLSKGQSVIADQIKEGVVIKPTVERWDQRLGRVITKLVGEQYLLRKGGTEHQ